MLWIITTTNVLIQEFYKNEILNKILTATCFTDWQKYKFMKKFIKAVVANPKYYLEKLTGKKRISCTDYSYFMNNGKSERLFYKLIELLGNKYNG